MIVVNIDPVALAIGPFTIRWYGLMYVVAIVIGLLVAWPYARYRGISSDDFEKVVLWAVPAGLVGARLYYDLQQPLGQYLTDPVRLIAVWEGGMAFYGAIFAVVLTVIFLCWRFKIPVWGFLDVAVLFASVGQFFGRIGNIINGDVLGYPTTLPWGFVYANPNSFAPSHEIAYQPAAVYEAIGNIILFSILWFFRKRVKPGILFFIYIFGYSTFQIIVFFWRDNSIVVGGLKQAQMTAIIVIVLAALLYFWYSRRQPSTPATP
jgi:phosphatidylglycerol---prolipoprotein diacylglyceryl transferase